MQLAFEFCSDLPVRRRRPERLFFGLVSDSETSARAGQVIDRVICEHHLQGTRLKRERLHVSLHHIGGYKRLRPKFIYAATQAAKAVAIRSFEMIFRIIKSFEGAPSNNGRPRRWPLVLLGEGDPVVELHEVLGAAMERNGLVANEHFAPHMTLLYGSKPIPAQAIEPIRFVVKEFVLIHSELGFTRYNILGRWPLR